METSQHCYTRANTMWGGGSSIRIRPPGRTRPPREYDPHDSYEPDEIPIAVGPDDLLEQPGSEVVDLLAGVPQAGDGNDRVANDEPGPDR